jgi:hypothetical protein
MNDIRFHIEYHKQFNEIELEISHNRPKSLAGFMLSLEEILMLHFEIEKTLNEIRNNNA